MVSHESNWGVVLAESDELSRLQVKHLHGSAESADDSLVELAKKSAVQKGTPQVLLRKQLGGVGVVQAKTLRAVHFPDSRASSVRTLRVAISLYLSFSFFCSLRAQPTLSHEVAARTFFDGEGEKAMAQTATVNNACLISQRHPIALLYNDRAVLKNHHAAFAAQQCVANAATAGCRVYAYTRGRQCVPAFESVCLCAV